MNERFAERIREAQETSEVLRKVHPANHPDVTQIAEFGTAREPRRGTHLTKLAGRRHDGAEKEATVMTHHQEIGEWQGKELVDCNGERIGKLEDVYVDVESNEPMFGTVKEGLIGRHLTFVPLAGITIGPDNLQVTVSKEQVKTAPNIELRGDELSTADESTLFHHYQLNYTPPDSEAVSDSPAADIAGSVGTGRMRSLTRPRAGPEPRPALRASSATGLRSDGHARGSR